MKRGPILTRRGLLGVGAVGTSGLLLSGCEKLDSNPGFHRLLKSAEDLHRRSQRIVGGHEPLATEFSEREMSPIFRANGTQDPDTDEYNQLFNDDFTSFRLVIDGLVARPLKLSLAQLKRLPARTQITRHDCVEGWSAIGQWHGVPLHTLLSLSGLAPGARFAVFHCADNLNGGDSDDPSGQYYESIDMVDALHPQTILAYGMNGKDLPVAHGAPLRLRVERQLGYKQAKYVMRVELVDSLAHLGGGKGGYWEDRGYEWYAGI